MNSVEISAKTQEEAIETALKQLNASISDVDIQVIDEGSKGLFGLFGSRLARVRVTLKSGSGSDEDELDLDHLLHGERAKAAKSVSQKVEDELDVKSLLAEQKPAQRQTSKSTSAPVGERPEKTAASQPEQKKPDRTEKKQEPRRPEPVRRVNPERERKAAVEPKQEPVIEETIIAAEEQPEVTAAEESSPSKPRRSHHSRSRKPRQPKPAEGSAEQQPQEEAAAKPLPPKQVTVKPLEKPVVEPIPEEELQNDSSAGRAKSFLQELTRLMGVEVDLTLGKDSEGNLYVNMTGDPNGILIGRRGETLDALQYLTSLRVNRGQENYTRVTLDTENYRAKREDTLVRLANRMANRAVKSGRKVSLEPMNPYERRIIHSALQPNEAVDTHSEGEEPNRHVVITVRKN